VKLRSGSVEAPDVNLTSLVDVVLLLLIFFMVSTSFIRESELSIELPQASLQQTPSNEDAIEIAIAADGSYYVNGRALVNAQPRTLRRALERMLGGDGSAAGQRALTIRADAEASHQAVITAMDVAARVGLTRIDIATVNTGTPSGSDTP
jgi:biopolymer transport protein ExbD